jgi:hypothetical protein
MLPHIPDDIWVLVAGHLDEEELRDLYFRDTSLGRRVKQLRLSYDEVAAVYAGRPDRHVKLQDSNLGLSLMGLMTRLAQTPPTSASRHFPGDIDTKKALELVITHDNFPNLTYINVTLGTSLSGLQGRARKFGRDISTLEFLTIAVSAITNLAPTLKSLYLIVEVNEVLLHFLTLLVEKMTTTPLLVNLFLNLQCNKGVRAGALQRIPLLSSCFVNRFTTSLWILDLWLNPSVANIVHFLRRYLSTCPRTSTSSFWFIHLQTPWDVEGSQDLIFFLE